MSTTDPIAALASQTQAALASAQKQKSASNLGIDDFLTLMTTQLKNQDPMKPLEGTEFVAQLAQFGAVSGIQNMQSSIESLSNSLRSTQVLNGTTLVGHDVLAAADSFTYTQGVGVNGEIDVPNGASSLQIRITDSTGALVREINVVPKDGVNAFAWDGTYANGAPALSGDYDIEAIATVGGERGSLEVLMSGRVSSVTIDSTGTGLTLNTGALGALSMNNIRRVM
ncbi:MAG TPA: flagellar hook assembly protein FlgD [Povalibacter sp.]|uniref:flagellar hook assembly protein FlgD n=1 Tax=Povalibacter sp. TaxID=1962978 RepID=UPI002CD0D6AD|nr:flagellar hook assembly protein FlgD [Povalibacter sp.]HMN44450.1 flagellar hook assembly protein FlgD [Povalibacter sp.]